MEAELNKFKLFYKLFSEILDEIEGRNNIAFIRKINETNGIIFGDCKRTEYKRVWGGKNSLIKKVDKTEFIESIFINTPQKPANISDLYDLGTIISCNTFYDLYYRCFKRELRGLYDNTKDGILRSLDSRCDYETDISAKDVYSQISIKKLSIVWGRGSHLPVSESITFISNEEVNNYIYEFDSKISAMLLNTVKTDEKMIARSLFMNEKLLVDPNGIYNNIEDVIERKF